MKTEISVEIKGQIAGYIWMPNALCWKDFSYRVKKDETLRDAILHITNDGDFQSCHIVDGAVIATLYKQNKHITRYFDIRSPLFPSITDCVMDENGKDYEKALFAICDTMEEE